MRTRRVTNYAAAKYRGAVDNLRENRPNRVVAGDPLLLRGGLQNLVGKIWRTSEWRYPDGDHTRVRVEFKEEQQMDLQEWSGPDRDFRYMAIRALATQREHMKATGRWARELLRMRNIQREGRYDRRPRWDWGVGMR